MVPNDCGELVRSRPLALTVGGGLRRLLLKAEVDRAVIFGVLTTLRSFVIGPVTALLIAFYFTPELQGYYYTFGSLLALQIFAELGLGTVIIQFASHEWSGLSLDQSRRITGSATSLSRLVSLGRVAFRWYAVAGGLVATGLGIGGYIFLSQSPDPGFHWVAPWATLCLFTGVRLCLVAVWSLLEGCNQVSEVYRYRFVDGIVTSGAIWVAILMRAGLWTPIAGSVASLTWSAIFLRRHYREFFHPFFSSVIGPTISWRREIWPMQWRIAVSWLSGYFMFSLFTPVLFHYHGSVVAGQMGMTWSLVIALSGISSAWVFTKAPRFGMLIAKREYAALDRLLFRAASMALLVACCGGAAILALIYWLNVMGHPLARRVLPPLPTGLFVAAMVLMQISFPQSTYLRAHKKEPFLGLSVVGGTLVGFSTWLLGRRFGPLGMGAGYLGIVAVVVIPCGTLIWQRCRTAWHADVGDEPERVGGTAS